MDDPSCGVPRNAAIELRFDRFLLPATAARQSIRVYSGDPAGQVLLLPSYDVVERVLTFRVGGGARLLPGLLYRVELLQPELDPGGFGLRAFDGAGLEEGPVPLEWSFFTAREAPEPRPEPQPSSSCADALEVFRASGCVNCHGESAGAMGLSLQSGEALRRTAIRRVAHQADVGVVAGEPQVNPTRLGVGMPVLDPGSPATSYLLYKLLRNPRNFGAGPAACESAYAVGLPAGECLAPDEEERQRLEDWFVKLDPMPPGPGGALAGGLADLRTLQGFVLGGARTADCP